MRNESGPSATCNSRCAMVMHLPALARQLGSPSQRWCWPAPAPVARVDSLADACWHESCGNTGCNSTVELKDRLKKMKGALEKGKDDWIEGKKTGKGRRDFMTRKYYTLQWERGLIRKTLHDGAKGGGKGTEEGAAGKSKRKKELKKRKCFSLKWDHWQESTQSTSKTVS